MYFNVLIHKMIAFNRSQLLSRHGTIMKIGIDLARFFKKTDRLF